MGTLMLEPLEIFFASFPAAQPFDDLQMHDRYAAGNVRASFEE